MSGGSPGSTGTAPPPLPSSQPSAGSNPSATPGPSGAITPPIAPPGTAGSSGSPESTGSTVSQDGASGGGTLGNRTGLGRIGAESDRERRAQQRSDSVTRSICNGC
jgi:hypothetical protein